MNVESEAVHTLLPSNDPNRPQSQLVSSPLSANTDAHMNMFVETNDNRILLPVPQEEVYAELYGHPKHEQVISRNVRED